MFAAFVPALLLVAKEACMQSPSTAELALFQAVFVMFSPQTLREPPAALITICVRSCEADFSHEVAVINGVPETGHALLRVSGHAWVPQN